MSVSKFYRVDLNHMSRRCCRICTRPSDMPKGQICNTCSSVVRASHHAHVNLPIPFVHVCRHLQLAGRNVGNFVDAVYALLDEVDAKAWNWHPSSPAFHVPYTGSKEVY